MNRRLLLVLGLALALLISCVSTGPALKDGEYTIDLFTTNDIHGRYFDSLYVGNNTKESLLAVSSYMNYQREKLGEDRIVFIDAGDCLQGDNASYYYNYVDTKTKHIYARMAEYMKYDAIVVGNHDIETGHPVYDRIDKTMGIPFLAANAIKQSNGKPYFQEYTIVERQGLKIAILGFTNPGIKGWLAEEIWKGMNFESLIPAVQDEVDKVIAKENPAVVIAAVHSGTGKGDGNSLESQGLDLLNSLSNVDFVICSHDHKACIEHSGNTTLINAGSHCRNVGHGTVNIKVEGGRIVEKTTTGELVNINKNKVDEKMREMFRADYETVKAFTTRKVGELEMPLITRESFIGMCDYMNLIHTVCLSCEPAQLSMAAPLTYNGFVKAGDVLFNDLFTIYPYENQLYVVEMTGKEIRDYLEYSYNQWIQTASNRTDTVLRIAKKDDPRTGQKNWSFIERSYNFDSMAGAFYTVDVTKPRGQRVEITALADGTPFSMTGKYNVAMTSYRASGGGFIMSEGAGVNTDNIESRVVAKYPEIRELVYKYFENHKDLDGDIAAVTSEELAQSSVVGAWSFVPEKVAEPALKRDYSKLFPKRK